MNNYNFKHFKNSCSIFSVDPPRNNDSALTGVDSVGKLICEHVCERERNFVQSGEWTAFFVLFFLRGRAHKVCLPEVEEKGGRHFE